MSFRDEGGEKLRAPKLHLILSVILLSVVGAGCPSFPAGTYTGHLYLDQMKLDCENPPDDVTVKVDYGPDGKGTIQIRDLADQYNVMKPFSILRYGRKGIQLHKSFDLVIPDVRAQAFRLQKIPSEKKCYKYEDGTRFYIKVCFRESDFNLLVREGAVTKIRLLGNRHPVARNKILPENPKSFTIMQAMGVAFQKNAELQAERENMVGLQASVKAAYANLTPHLGPTFMGSLAGGGLDPLSLIGGVGDIVPFLFPDNWIRAKVQNYEYKAARVAELLLKINTANSVHSLALNFLGNRELRNELIPIRDRFAKVMSVVIHLQEKKQFSEIEVELLKSVLSAIEGTVNGAEAQVAKDVHTLASVLGLANPDGVIDIEGGQIGEAFAESGVLAEGVFNINNIPLLNPKELLLEKQRYSQMAITQSFELRQQDFLMEAAELNRGSLSVSWLNPAGSGEAPLGFSLYYEYKKAGSVLRALDLKIQAIEKSIRNNAHVMVTDRNMTRALYNLVSTSLPKRRELFFNVTEPFLRLSSLETARLVGVADTEPLNLDGLKDAAEVLVEGLTAYYSAWATIQMDQAALDRIAFEGVYTKLRAELEDLWYGDDKPKPKHEKSSGPELRTWFSTM